MSRCHSLCQLAVEVLCEYTGVSVCLCTCISELQDTEPSPDPSSVPTTKSQIQQRAADIQRQLEVCHEFLRSVLSEQLEHRTDSKISILHVVLIITTWTLRSLYYM